MTEKPADTMPVLRIDFVDGNKPDTKLATSISIRIPRELPAKIAKMYIVEHVAKELKRYAAGEALSGLGFK